MVLEYFFYSLTNESNSVIITDSTDRISDDPSKNALTREQVLKD